LVRRTEKKREIAFLRKLFSPNVSVETGPAVAAEGTFPSLVSTFPQSPRSKFWTVIRVGSRCLK
jgi:hypothetical protein